MPIIQKKVNIKWSKTNKEHYIKQGYIFTKSGDKFEINVLDLYPGSHQLVECKCDYCETTIFKEFRAVNPNKKVDAINQLKISCSNINCVNKKIEETHLEKYGCKNALQNKEIRNKIKETCIKKYGVDNPSKVKEVKEKIKQTFIKNYGVDNPRKSEVIKAKMRETFIKKYGVDNPMKSEKIWRRAVSKSIETMHKNGNTPISKQQKYLHELLGGELNYPVDLCRLDIAFPNEKIYVEYNGGGHGWWMLANGRENEFNYKEMERKTFLQSKGWKIIRINSRKDKLPSNEVIISLIKECKDYLLNSNHSWIDIDIDTSEIKCSKYIKKIKLGNVKTIYSILKSKKELIK